MCKFENVQMCRWSKNLLACIFILLSGSLFAQSSGDFWKERKAATLQLCKYLENQRVDSIFISLPEQASKDTILRRQLTSASIQVQEFKVTTKKLILREASSSCSCWYMDGDTPRMLVIVSFDLSGNSCKISAINIFDQNEIQSKGLSPFPPPPPPPPKPR